MDTKAKVEACITYGYKVIIDAEYTEGLVYFITLRQGPLAYDIETQSATIDEALDTALAIAHKRAQDEARLEALINS